MQLQTAHLSKRCAMDGHGLAAVKNQAPFVDPFHGGRRRPPLDLSRGIKCGGALGHVARLQLVPGLTSNPLLNVSAWSLALSSHRAEMLSRRPADSVLSAPKGSTR